LALGGGVNTLAKPPAHMTAGKYLKLLTTNVAFKIYISFSNSDNDKATNGPDFWFANDNHITNKHHSYNHAD